MDQQIEQSQQKTKSKFDPSQGEKDEEQPQKVQVYNPLRELYQSTKLKFGQDLSHRIKESLVYREDRIFNLFANEKKDYFGSMWNHMRKLLARESPYYENDILRMLSDRSIIIIEEIYENKLNVQEQKTKAFDYDQQHKQKKLTMLRDQSSQIQKKLVDINDGLNQIKNHNQTSESRFKAFEINEQKVKQYEQFLRKQKKEKEERSKVMEEQKKKQEEGKLKRQHEDKELKEKLVKDKKEELLKKMKENEQKRQKQRAERQQRNNDYKFISKSLAQQPPLFKKLQQSFYHRYQKNQKQKRSKIMSQRHSMFESMDNKLLQEHERKYQEMRSQKQKMRRERQEQLQRMLQLQQEQLQSKYKSSFEMERYVDHKEEEKKIAKEKRQKVKKFIEETVKEKYLPRIDEQKRKQIMKMIEDLHKKKVKKVKKQDGTYEYEQLKPSDPRMMGLQYLQKTKEMAAKMRGRRKESVNIQQTDSQKPKIFDYLAQKRKKGSSKSHRDRMQFVNRKGLTFDDKLKKVQLQSQKLQQLAKQKQMKLKFGKFTTSDQILQHKEQIDQHYIDIINMKLKLINYKEE